MKINIYDMVTNRILEQLEKGVVPWRKTWKGSEPINFVTRKPYQGINTLLLPYGGEYLTFLQAIEAGGGVKKGEKSFIIVFYKPLEVEDKGSGIKKKVPLLKYSNVFHISQCEGVASKLEVADNCSDIEPIQAAQDILDSYVSNSGVTLSHIEGSRDAFYKPSTDTITLPTIRQFESAEEYYSTAFHEAAHSTGHKSRLGRADINDTAAFGSQSYSKEELTAEISACMLMNATGIEIPESFENSAAYIKAWSKKLKEDKKAILTASSQAQKATDYILGINKNERGSAPARP